MLAACAARPASAAILPTVGSGTLVAQFLANDATVARNGLGHVSAWTAANNPAIVLSAFGDDGGNIVYDPLGMHGAPTLVVRDPAFGGDNQVLRGAVPGTRTATTIFWLGYYDPGRDGISDGSGLYAYSYGADGADGSQLDHQMDSGNFELFGGSGTQTGDDITSYDSQYTIWRTVYGPGSAHTATADGASLNIPSPNSAAYSVTGSLQLFGFQNSLGTSGGFNFVGNMSELLIYDGALDAADIAAVEAYLADRRENRPSSNSVPEPSSCIAFGLTLFALIRRKFPRNSPRRG